MGTSNSVDHLVIRQVRELTMEMCELHVCPAVPVERVIDAVTLTVEFQWRHAIEAAQRLVEHRCRLDPPAAQLHRGQAVVVKDVTADELSQAVRCEVIANVGQHKAAGYANRP